MRLLAILGVIVLGICAASLTFVAFGVPDLKEPLFYDGTLSGAPRDLLLPLIFCFEGAMALYFLAHVNYRQSTRIINKLAKNNKISEKFLKKLPKCSSRPNKGISDKLKLLADKHEPADRSRQAFELHYALLSSSELYDPSSSRTRVYINPEVMDLGNCVTMFIEE
jgi:hypothetical protein